MRREIVNRESGEIFHLSHLTSPLPHKHATVTRYILSPLQSLAVKVPLPLLAVILLFGCARNPDINVVTSETAFVPVYADTHNVRPVAIEASRPTAHAGKIYVYGRYIFQNEQNEGIHIIDNSDPSHPIKKAFLSIPYNTEMAIRASHIYANSINDILVINLDNPLQPQVVNRIKNAFPLISQDFPPEGGYFICPDHSKGIVVDWKPEHVTGARCRR